MTAPRFHLSGFPRAIGLAVILHLLAVLWMAASPTLHAATHADASEPGHSCCVTMFEAGNFHAPTTHADFAVKPEMLPVSRVESHVERIAAVRFSPGVLEHAPPATA